MAGKIQIKADRRYLQNRKWRFLYEGWQGWHNIQYVKMINTIDTYFTLLKKSLISIENGEFNTDKAILLKAAGNSASKRYPDKKVVDLYSKNPGEIASQIVLGYELEEYLHGDYRQRLSIDLNRPLWEIEEGLANWISSSLINIPYEETQKWAPQDIGKIELAKRINETGASLEEAIQEIRSYDDLSAFYKKIEI